MSPVRQNKVWLIYGVLLVCGIIWLIFSFANFCDNGEEKAILEKHIVWYKEQLKENRHEIESLHSKLEDYEQKLQRSYHAIKQKSCGPSIKTEHDPNLPTLYIITPTYSRPEQKAELTRLSHTFLLVPKLHWIVIEDSPTKTHLVTNFLQNSGLTFIHLNAVTPIVVKLKSSDPNWLKPRGVVQRNTGLTWLRTALNPARDKGVVYFADDDNTYSLELFEEMRNTAKVSVWPVGLVGGLRYEGPIVVDGKVIKWFTYWKPDRPFALDMAGFAVNISLFFEHSSAWFSNKVPRGYQESTILKGLGISMTDLEPKADGCTKVLVWHTRTEKIDLKNEILMFNRTRTQSDPNIEV